MCDIDSDDDEIWEAALQIEQHEIALFPKQSSLSSSFVHLLNLKSGIINRKFLKYPSHFKFQQLSIAYRQQTKEIFVLTKGSKKQFLYIINLDTLKWNAACPVDNNLRSVKNIVIKNGVCYMMESHLWGLQDVVDLFSLHRETNLFSFHHVTTIKSSFKAEPFFPDSETILPLNYYTAGNIMIFRSDGDQIDVSRFNESDDSMTITTFSGCDSQNWLNFVYDLVILRNDIILCFRDTLKYKAPWITIIDVWKSTITKSCIISPEPVHSVKVVLIENLLQEELIVFGWCRKYSIYVLPLAIIKIICTEYCNDKLLFILNTNEEKQDKCSIYFATMKVDHVLIEEKQRELSPSLLDTNWLQFNKFDQDHHPNFI